MPKEAIASIEQAINVNDHYDIYVAHGAASAKARLTMKNFKRYCSDGPVIESGVLEEARVVFGGVSSFGCNLSRDYNGCDVILTACLDNDIDDDVKRRLGLSDQDIEAEEDELYILPPHGESMTQWLEHVDNGVISLRWDPEFDTTTPFVIIVDRNTWRKEDVSYTHDIVVYYPDPSRLH